jgi:Domain of unknown function (DUF4251)
MKTKILVVLLCLTSLEFSAQDLSTSVNGLKTEKQLKKEKKEEEKNLQYIATGVLLDSMHFVLEADYLSNYRGQRIMAAPSLNYILIDSIKGIIQTGTNFGTGGNGVGGATAKGTISKWKLTKNENKKTYFIKIDFSTDLGFYTVFMDVSADGRASATMTGISRGSLTFDGKLVPLKRSKVFKGRSGY